MATELASGIREVCLACGYYGFGKADRRYERTVDNDRE
jgi:hypothetical protein